MRSLPTLGRLKSLTIKCGFSGVDYDCFCLLFFASSITETAGSVIHCPPSHDHHLMHYFPYDYLYLDVEL